MRHPLMLAIYLLLPATIFCQEWEHRPHQISVDTEAEHPAELRRQLGQRMRVERKAATEALVLGDEHPYVRHLDERIVAITKQESDLKERPMAGMETTNVLWTWNKLRGRWDFHSKYADPEKARKAAEKISRKTTITPVIPRKTTITPVMLPTKPKD